MDESSNNPADARSGIGETITTALRQPSLLRVMLGLAAMVVVFVGMRLAAPILNPILFALVLALLFSPIYAWLTRHRIPTPLALVIMLVGLTVLFVGIFLIMGVSIARFSGDIASYAGKLNVQAADGSFAYEPPVLHPEDKGVTLTAEERLHLIRSIDLGGQYYARQSTGFRPFTADPISGRNY